MEEGDRAVDEDARTMVRGDEVELQLDRVRRKLVRDLEHAAVELNGAVGPNLASLSTQEHFGDVELSATTTFAGRVADVHGVGTQGSQVEHGPGASADLLGPIPLIGLEVQARLYPNTVEVWYRGEQVEVFPHVRGEGAHRIDYRHVIGSLVRKPGAFANYRFREDLFPTVVCRRAYDVLHASHGARADVEYVRILKLAADTMESDVQGALATLLGAAQ